MASNVYGATFEIDDVTQCISEGNLVTIVDESKATASNLRRFESRVGHTLGDDSCIVSVRIDSYSSRSEKAASCECRHILGLTRALLLYEINAAHQSTSVKSRGWRVQPELSLSFGPNISRSGLVAGHGGLSAGMSLRGRVFGWVSRLNLLAASPLQLGEGLVWNQSLMLDLGARLDLFEWVFDIFMTGGLNWAQTSGFVRNQQSQDMLIGFGTRFSYRFSDRFLLGADLRSHLNAPDYRHTRTTERSEHSIFIASIVLGFHF